MNTLRHNRTPSPTPATARAAGLLFCAALLSAASSPFAHHASPQSPAQGISYVPPGVERTETAAGQPVADTTITRTGHPAGRSAPEGKPAHPMPR